MKRKQVLRWYKQSERMPCKIYYDDMIYSEYVLLRNDHGVLIHMYYYDFKKDEFGNISKTVSLDYKGWENLMSYILYLSNIPEVNKERYFLDYINNRNIKKHKK